MGNDPGDFESLLDRLAPGAGRRRRKDRGSGSSIRTVPIRTRGLQSSAIGAQVEVHLTTANLPTTATPPEETRERLGWASLQMAIATLVIYAVYCLTQTPDHLAALLSGGTGGGGLVLPVDHLAANLLIAGSVGVFLLARGRRIPTRLVDDTALLYFVAVAAGISLFELWQPRPTDVVQIGFPWVCLWILLFPMVIPIRGGKFVLAVLAAAASAPMALLLSVAVHGSGLPGATVMAWLIAPTALAAALAVYPTPFIHRLETAARAARELGSYQLVERLGRGSMGEVWRARHRLLARPAAIKLIRPELLGGGTAIARSQALHRFEREAEITASLRSPHTVQIYDFGVTEDGSLYTVMELLEGTDLQTLVETRGPFPPGRVVRFLTQACASLAEAHAHGLVHRDIKPANLVTCRYGMEVDQLKVLDFGLVRAPADDGDEALRLTADGMTLGTPAYMAPEMVGGAGDYDHRVDLYALGCVGCFLLTGAPVFEAANAMALLMCHLDKEPKKPSERAEDIPPDLERVLMACLAKEPGGRPADAAELSRMLEDCRIPEPWTDEQAREWWQRNYPAGADAGGAAEERDAAEAAEPP